MSDWRCAGKSPGEEKSLAIPAKQPETRWKKNAKKARR